MRTRRKAERDFRTYRGRDRYRLLLDGAKEAFTKRGYQRTRVEDITKEAGCSHGNFYNYFRNKDDAFRVVSRGALEQFAHLNQGELWSSRDPVQGIGETISEYLRLLRENAAIFRVWWEAGVTSRAMGRSWDKARKPLLDLLVKNIVNLQSAGWADKLVNPAATSAILLGALEQFGFITWVVNRDALQAEEVDRSMQALTDCWVRSVRAETQR